MSRLLKSGIHARITSVSSWVSSGLQATTRDAIRILELLCPSTILVLRSPKARVMSLESGIWRSRPMQRCSSQSIQKRWSLSVGQFKALSIFNSRPPIRRSCEVWSRHRQRLQLQLEHYGQIPHLPSFLHFHHHWRNYHSRKVYRYSSILTLSIPDCRSYCSLYME